MTSKFTKSLLGTALLTGLLVAGASGAQTLGGGGSDAFIGAADARVNAAALADSYRYDAIIVGYNEGDARAAGDAVSAISRHLDQVASRTGQTLSYVRTLSTGGHLVKIGKALDDGSLLKVMNDLAADPNVAYVEPDQIMVPFLSPNDSSYSQQWHYFEATGGANLPTAWDNATGSGVVVAVLDTGITSHTDLNANVVAGYDFVSSSTNARDGNGRDSNPADQGDWTTAGQCYSGSPASNSSWHGTHVAGTIAAVTNNASGVAGVAFNAKIQPVRVLAACGGTLSDIADAITWASGGSVSGVPANATPAKVINMSLGGSSSTCASTYQNAINGAVNRGTVVIVAAGNSNVNASGATPANCSNVVTVAATNRSGGRAYYSNFGTLVDVAAPGGDVRSSSSNGILSTLNSGTTTPGSQSYAWYQGTSMATPHVAGLAALILSKGSKTPAQIESLLKSNARPFPASCSGCGAGIIDAAATIAAVTGGGGGTPPPSGGVLSKGVPVTGSTNSSSANSSFAEYTVVVPSGSTNLNIATTNASGDVDLYVRYGSAPSLTSYDCRPYTGSGNETCTFAAPSAGTYYIRVYGYATGTVNFTLTANWTAGGGGGTQPSFFENQTNYNITDNSTIESPISVSGRTGNAPSTLKVAVTIYHTYKGDLKVDLIAPDGSVYVLHNRSGGGTDNIIQTFTVNASTEVANGTWKLRVNDNARGDTGYLDKWSLQF
ncbi:MAG: S8 family serine peptidase [Xanthomonadales bacterium]|nr:S8 family serine peptidase [Xanthomonadales bacterium]MCB1610618.1 S8 family serine peptidase [Xanthomonadales bacterium]